MRHVKILLSILATVVMSATGYTTNGDMTISETKELTPQNVETPTDVALRSSSIPSVYFQSVSYNKYGQYLLMLPSTQEVSVTIENINIPGSTEVLVHLVGYTVTPPGVIIIKHSNESFSITIPNNTTGYIRNWSFEARGYVAGTGFVNSYYHFMQMY